MPLEGCKTWEESKVQIERTLYTTKSSGLDIGLKSGLQLRTSISHYPSPIFSTCYRNDSANKNEYFVINYISMDGGESIIVEWEYDNESHVLSVKRKFKIRNCLKHLVWIANQRAFVGYCDDMTLRAYKGQTMEEKVRVSVSSSALYVLYLEDFDDLLVAGQGHINTWRLHQIEFGLPFEWKDPQISCEIIDNQDIWITYLWYSRRTKTLLALCSEAVYFIDMTTRKQVGKMENSHQASLTSCAWFPRFSYMITAARDGSLNVYHTVTNALVHKLPAHRDGITGVACLPNQPILLSWSNTSGCLRLWRLDTFEMLDESALAEGFATLSLARPDRLFYQTESEIRIFDVKILFTISTTLSAPAQSMKLCWIKATGVEHSKSEAKSTTERPDNVDDCDERKSLPDSQMSCSLANTEPTSRLMCILEDGCVVSVSPVTGSLVHIIYPPTGKERDKHPVDVALNFDGSASFILPRNNEIMEYDCTANPGREIKTQQYMSNVTSIAGLEATFWPDTGDSAADTLDATATMVLLGCDTGLLKIHQEASFVMLGSGMKKPLTMESVKIHSGAVTNIFVSPERQAFTACVKRSVGLSFHGVFITTGTNRLAFVWMTNFTKATFGLGFQMVPVKLHKMTLDRYPTLVAGTGSSVMFAHRDGLISIWKIIFKIDLNGTSNEVLLSKRVPIDEELKHQAPITSVSGSELLNIFLTCGYAELIKIWDLNGQLLRELDIGRDCFAACFSNGRDIAASYKSHIIVIEAQDYLPFEVLEALIQFNEEFMIKDACAEIPVAMDDGSGFGTTPTLPIRTVVEVDLIGTAGDGNAFNSTKKSKSARNQRKKFNDFAAKKFQMYLTRQEKLLEHAESDVRMQERVRRQTILLHMPPRVVDPAILTDAIIMRMKLWPVAPDCYIPNSVIRRFVEPAYTSFTQNNRRKVSTLSEMELEETTLATDRQSWDSAVLVPSTIFIEQDVESACKPLRRLTALEKLLECLRKEKWCPDELRVQTLDRGLVALADVLDNATSGVILKILAAILKICEECRAYPLPIRIPCQRVIARKLYSLLRHGRAEIRETAACLLSKFDMRVMEGFREEFLIPGLKTALESLPSEGRSGNKVLMEYAMCIASVTKHVDTNLLASARKGEKFIENEPMAIERVKKIINDCMAGWGVQAATAEVWTKYIFGQTEHGLEEISTQGQHLDEMSAPEDHSTGDKHDTISVDVKPDENCDRQIKILSSNAIVLNRESTTKHTLESRGESGTKSLLRLKSCTSNHSELICWEARRPEKCKSESICILRCVGKLRKRSSMPTDPETAEVRTRRSSREARQAATPERKSETPSQDEEWRAVLQGLRRMRLASRSQSS